MPGAGFKRDPTKELSISDAALDAAMESFVEHRDFDPRSRMMLALSAAMEVMLARSESPQEEK